MLLLMVFVAIWDTHVTRATAIRRWEVVCLG